MGFIEKIKNLFIKIFKKDDVKLLETPKQMEEVIENTTNQETREKKEAFINSLKINIIKKTKIFKVRENIGCGLGFKGKMQY